MRVGEGGGGGTVDCEVLLRWILKLLPCLQQTTCQAQFQNRWPYTTPASHLPPSGLILSPPILKAVENSSRNKQWHQKHQNSWSLPFTLSEFYLLPFYFSARRPRLARLLGKASNYEIQRPKEIGKKGTLRKQQGKKGRQTKSCNQYRRRLKNRIL